MEGQIELSRNLQVATAAVDSTGMCLCIAFAALDDQTCLPALIDLINARFGTSLAGDDVVNLGKHILKTERAFNTSAGITNRPAAGVLLLREVAAAQRGVRPQRRGNRHLLELLMRVKVKRIRSINPAIFVEAIVRPFTEADINAVDIVVDGLDAAGNRLEPAAHCTRLERPLVHGVVRLWHGQAGVAAIQATQTCKLILGLDSPF